MHHHYKFNNNPFHIKKSKYLKFLFVIFISLISSSCGTFLQIGPESLQDDRGEFNQVIAETNDQQLLIY